MAIIGKPAGMESKFASTIKMSKENLAESLNKAAGNTPNKGIKYVNREDKEKLDKNGFLRILTSQLTNQDPFNPMDQKDMTAELAQIGALEQMTNMNSKLDKLIGNPKMQGQVAALSFLGKKITTSGSTVEFDGSSAGVDIPINLPLRGKEVSVRISDSKGQVIRQLTLLDLPEGFSQVHWDGKKDDQSLIGKGTYNISVFGKDETEKVFSGESKVKGLVTGVKFKDGEIVLKLSGEQEVYLRDVENLEDVNEKSQNKQ